jgi:hypothetical protein
MLKNIILGSFLTCSLLVSTAIAKDLKFGKEIELKETTKVSEVLAKPELFLGKNILIEGKVVDVCTKRGCWMKVSSDKKGQSVVIKVNDGEIVFPVEARGKDTMVEGELYKIEPSEKDKKEMKHDKMSDQHEHKEIKTIYMFKPKAIVIK